MRAVSFKGGFKDAAALLVLAGALAVAGLAPVRPAAAQGLQLGLNTRAPSRQETFRNQTQLMDGRLATQYSRASTRLDLRIDTAAAASVPRYRGNYRGEYLETARSAARRHGIPEELFLRLVHQESRWDPSAVSTAGARGLAQLMPDTARLLGVNPDDPRQNLDGGARYLRMMYDQFGDWRLALAAYNAGPGAVTRHGGVPPYRETTDYVRIILGAG